MEGQRAPKRPRNHTRVEIWGTAQAICLMDESHHFFGAPFEVRASQPGHRSTRRDVWEAKCHNTNTRGGANKGLQGRVDYALHKIFINETASPPT